VAEARGVGGTSGRGWFGYVGLGEVTGTAKLAKDVTVARDGESVPLLEVARADMTREGTSDSDTAEWVVPVRWSRSVAREHAVKDSDFFANQNIAVRLTHGYTTKRLEEAFEGSEAATGSS